MVDVLRWRSCHGGHVLKQRGGLDMLSCEDGCRDEHGWHSARILRGETLQTRNFRRYQLACVPGPCGFQGICLYATTRMSTTLKMNNNCGTSTVFTQPRPRAPVVAQTTGMSTTLSKIWNCAISTGLLHSQGPWTLVVTQQTDMSTNLSKNCTCGISTGFCTDQDHGHLSLHNGGHVNKPIQDLQLCNLHGLPGTCCCTTKNMSTTLSKVCNCAISTGLCTVSTMATCR